jgi:NAD(P)-dependent dehydrogenase (short-subunit alcohol dehydrogenase family)
VKSLAKEYKKYPISIHTVIPGMVATDFYRNIKVGTNQEDNLESIPFVLKAFGVPVEEVGEFFVRVAAQKPGRVTGKTYSLLKGLRLARGIGLIMYYRITGKVKARM